MKIILIGKIAILFLLVGVLFLPNRVQQSPNKSINISSAERLSKVVRRDGWELPALIDLKETGTVENKIDGVQTNLTFYKPLKRIEVQVDDYFLPDNEGGLLISSHDGSIKTVQQYQINKKIFAYKISYGSFSRTEEFGTVELGALTTYFYVDEDNDGKFETRYETKLPDSLPSWIK